MGRSDGDRIDAAYLVDCQHIKMEPIIDIDIIRAIRRAMGSTLDLLGGFWVIITDEA